jgi:hypothetical protein
VQVPKYTQRVRFLSDLPSVAEAPLTREERAVEDSTGVGDEVIEEFAEARTTERRENERREVENRIET